MNRFVSAASKLRGARPLSLLITSLMMALTFIIVIVSRLYRWHEAYNPFLMFLVGLLIGASALWFYWNGYSVARYLVLLTSVSVTLDALYSISGFHALVYLASEASGSWYLNALRLCSSLYFIIWLLTPEARRYFSTDARHERKSLAYASRLQQ